jgi:hypothetical protein
VFDDAGETFVALEGGEELFCSGDVFGGVDDALACVFGIFARVEAIGFGCCATVSAVAWRDLFRGYVCSSSRRVS